MALLAQRGLSTGKLERKFSGPQGSGIKEPGLRDLWHTELLADPTTLSCSHTHRVTCTDTHTYFSRSTATHSETCKKQIRNHFQEHLGSMLVTLCLRCLIYLRAVHLFLPSDKRCLSLCGSWGWRTLACIRTVRRSVADQRFNEPCLRSLIKNLTDAHMLAHTGSARVKPGAYAHACMQTRAAWVNDDVISPDILEMSGSGDMLRVICSLRVWMCACASALCLQSCWRLYNEHDGHSVLCHSEKAFHLSSSEKKHTHNGRHNEELFQATAQNAQTDS